MLEQLKMTDIVGCYWREITSHNDLKNDLWVTCQSLFQSPTKPVVLQMMKN